METWTGWAAVLAIVVAASIPLLVRFRAGKRAAPSSQPIKTHVVVGIVTSGCAFAHTLVVIPALGSPAATGAGMTAIAPAGLAFFLLVAHAGLGLQLRNEKLKTRAKTRRSHAITAILIATAVTIHVVALRSQPH